MCTMYIYVRCGRKVYGGLVIVLMIMIMIIIASIITHSHPCVVHADGAWCTYPIY